MTLPRSARKSLADVSSERLRASDAFLSPVQSVLYTPAGRADCSKPCFRLRKRQLATGSRWEVLGLDPALYETYSKSDIKRAWFEFKLTVARGSRVQS